MIYSYNCSGKRSRSLPPIRYNLLYCSICTITETGEANTPLSRKRCGGCQAILCPVVFEIEYSTQRSQKCLRGSCGLYTSILRAKNLSNCAASNARRTGKHARYISYKLQDTHSLSLSRNMSNSTDILQHRALRLCVGEQFVFTMCPSKTNTVYLFNYYDTHTKFSPHILTPHSHITLNFKILKAIYPAWHIN